jgi:pyrroline-5-carboxylate reductase
MVALSFVPTAHTLAFSRRFSRVPTVARAVALRTRVNRAIPARSFSIAREEDNLSRKGSKSMSDSMSDYELGIIGSGNMAQAIVRGVIAAGLVPAGRIVASDVAPQQRDRMAALGVAAVEDNAAPAACPRVLLAVKPQMMRPVLEAAAPKLAREALVISIAAGITTASLSAWLGGRGRIIRVMPNTPMLVGAGMSALSAGPRATEGDMLWAEKLFASCGRTTRVGEELLDAVTAVSGSGPAYLFYLAEAMIAAGVAEGLPEGTARTLAAQTCVGASKLLIESPEPPETLRARVTSPGGTTQRAIETLDAAGVKAALVQAIRAAAARSRELGK